MPPSSYLASPAALDFATAPAEYMIGGYNHMTSIAESIASDKNTAKTVVLVYFVVLSSMYPLPPIQKYLHCRSLITSQDDNSVNELEFWTNEITQFYHGKDQHNNKYFYHYNRDL